MARRSPIPREVRAQVRKVQRDSAKLAREPLAASTELRPFHDTVTVAVRLVRSDAQAITALADQQGVSVSTLLREWISTGLAREKGETLDATLKELEQGIRRLRKALN